MCQSGIVLFLMACCPSLRPSSSFLLRKTLTKFIMSLSLKRSFHVSSFPLEDGKCPSCIPKHWIPEGKWGHLYPQNLLRMQQTGLVVKRPDWTPQNDFVDQLVMLIQVNATVAASLVMVGNETFSFCDWDCYQILSSVAEQLQCQLNLSLVRIRPVTSSMFASCH